jgi:hypothetical protein
MSAVAGWSQEPVHIAIFVEIGRVLLAVTVSIRIDALCAPHQTQWTSIDEEPFRNIGLKQLVSVYVCRFKGRLGQHWPGCEAKEMPHSKFYNRFAVHDIWILGKTEIQGHGSPTSMGLFCKRVTQKKPSASTNG